MLLLSRCVSEENREEDIQQVLKLLQELRRGKTITNNPQFIKLIQQGHLLYNYGEAVIAEDGEISREEKK